MSHLRSLATAALAALAACEAPTPRTEASCLENVALGEVRERSAILWARSAEHRFLHARALGSARGRVASFLPRYDHTARLRLGPEDGGELVVWGSDGGDANEAPPECTPRPVRFAPAAGERVPVRFAFGGDVGGQNVCRDAEHGFPTLPAMVARAHDFRVLLGDMIYADGECLAQGALGNAQVPLESPPLPALEAYRAHWRYAEEDTAYRALRWGAYAVWDDHEILNDAGPRHDTLDRVVRRRVPGATVRLLPVGRRGLLEHDALAIGPGDVGTPLHRRFRWGAQLELVLLDTRSYRADNAALDDGPEPKTMLGPAQRHWLGDVLRNSDATWLVIVSSVPIALPTGPNGRRDSWADGGTGAGFARELLALLDVARRAGRRNLVFLTTDVHFTDALVHRPFPEDPGFVVHELVTGPLSAGLFPFDELDTSLGTERLLHHVPEGPVRTLADARPYFTWGEVAIDAHGAMTLSVRDADQETWALTLPAPAP